MHYVVDQFNSCQLYGMVRTESIYCCYDKNCYDQDNYIKRSNTFDKVASKENGR